MNRDYWTVYDDDTRDFEQELEQEERTIQLKPKSQWYHNPNRDHFDKESDLFEV